MLRNCVLRYEIEYGTHKLCIVLRSCMSDTEALCYEVTHCTQMLHVVLQIIKVAYCTQKLCIVLRSCTLHSEDVYHVMKWHIVLRRCISCYEVAHCTQKLDIVF